MIDPKTVEKREQKIEEAVTEVIVKMGLKKLPLLPSRHTFQMMAKAAASPSTRLSWRTSDGRNEYEAIGRQGQTTAPTGPGTSPPLTSAQTVSASDEPLDSPALSRVTCWTRPRWTGRCTGCQTAYYLVHLMYQVEGLREGGPSGSDEFRRGGKECRGSAHHLPGWPGRRHRPETLPALAKSP